MKMYIFRDGLFCWVCAVVASNLEEAIEFVEKAGINLMRPRLTNPDPYPNDPDTGYTVEEIVPGLIITGGGNG